MGNSNFLDDLAKFGNTALSEADKMQRQVRNWAGEKVDDIVESMDVVTQDELDAVKEGYEKRIADLEKRLSALEGKKTTATKKPAAKKAPAKDAS